MNVPQLRFDGFSGPWSKKKIKEIAFVTSGLTPLRSRNEFFKNGTIPWVKTMDLNNSIVKDTQERVTEVAMKETSLKLLPANTLLIAMYGGFNQIGRTGLINFSGTTNQAISALTPKENSFSPFFLQSYLNFNVEKWKRLAASSRKDPNITKSDIENFVVKIPSIAEQNKMASFFKLIDQKIEKQHEKVKNLEQFKKGMMQKIFTQELRFKDEDGGEFPVWEEKLIGDFLSESRIIGSKGDTANKLTVKLWGKGIIAKKEAVQGSINTQYYTRKTGQLIYGKLDFLNCAFGIVPPEFDGYESTLDSPAFDIKNIDHRFLLKYITREEFFLKYGSQANGSRRAKRIHPEVFFEMPIHVPSIEEQNKIGSFLDLLEQKIVREKEKLTVLAEQKKGLIQGLFV